MTLGTSFVIGLLALALSGFVLKKYYVYIIALPASAILFVSKLLPHEKATTVFANPVFISVSATFTLSATLVKAAIPIDYPSNCLDKAAKLALSCGEFPARRVCRFYLGVDQ